MKHPYLDQFTNGEPRIKVLLDADVILELFINRSPFVEEAEKLQQLLVNAEYSHLIEVYVTDKCLRRIHFELGESDIDLGEKAVAYVEEKLNLKVINIDKNLREQARTSPLRDFDSAEEVVCANAMNLDAIITLNPQNFDEATLPIWSAKDLLKCIHLEKSFEKEYIPTVSSMTVQNVFTFQGHGQLRSERSSKFSEQFDQVVEAIIAGKYSWACVLILRFHAYNPLHYIPYRTYNRLLRENAFFKNQLTKEENNNSLSVTVKDYSAKCTMNPEQFDQVVEAIIAGKYSWACVLILRFHAYNPLNYIPHFTYKRLLQDNNKFLEEDN